MSRRIALIIGNSEFQEITTFPNLRTPINDAQDFAGVLREYGDFEIFDVLLNENADSVRYAIEAFYSEAQRGDLTLLYYSGHGYRGSYGQLGLIAKNTEKNRLLSTGIPDSFIRDVMRDTRSRHQIVILDCCFSGALIPGKKGEDESTLLENLKGEATVVLASSSRAQFSFEEEGRNSLFTRCLLAGITTGAADINGDGKITIEELYAYAQRQVINQRPQQTPVIENIQRASEIVIAKVVQPASARIFICHTSEARERYFATWLVSKLSFVGFEVSASLGMNGGLADLEKLITQSSSKILFIISNESISNEDAKRELAIAEGASKRNFIIPILFEQVPLDQLPEVWKEKELIDFSENWASGLEYLVNGLTQDLPHRTDNKVNAQAAIENWFVGLELENDVDAERQETYRTNWFELKLPEQIYLTTGHFR